MISLSDIPGTGFRGVESKTKTGRGLNTCRFCHTSKLDGLKESIERDPGG